MKEEKKIKEENAYIMEVNFRDYVVCTIIVPIFYLIWALLSAYLNYYFDLGSSLGSAIGTLVLLQFTINLFIFYKNKKVAKNVN